MGSFYGLGSWSRLPIEWDDDVFIIIPNMKNPIMAKYDDYGRIKDIEIVGEFVISDKNHKLLITNESPLKNIEEFINSNIKTPSNGNSKYDVYIDHKFLYNSIMEQVHYNTTFLDVMYDNYLYPRDEYFCAGQDNASNIQRVYYNSINKYLEESKKEYYKELFKK